MHKLDCCSQKSYSFFDICQLQRKHWFHTKRMGLVNEMSANWLSNLNKDSEGMMCLRFERFHCIYVSDTCINKQNYKNAQRFLVNDNIYLYLYFSPVSHQNNGTMHRFPGSRGNNSLLINRLEHFLWGTGCHRQDLSWASCKNQYSIK